MQKTLCLLAVTLMGAAAFAQGHEAKGPDAQAVDQQCTSDAATAGCGSEKVGTGLLKCLHAYKRAHKEFKFSAACKGAMEKARTDRRARKGS